MYVLDLEQQLSQQPNAVSYAQRLLESEKKMKQPRNKICRLRAKCSLKGYLNSKHELETKKKKALFILKDILPQQQTFQFISTQIKQINIAKNSLRWSCDDKKNCIVTISCQSQSL